MFPQVLLIGNGLNKTYDADGWGNLIKKIHCNPKIDPKSIEKVAFPLQAVLATGDRLDSQIKSKKDIFYGMESVDQIRPMMENILRIPFDYILTTNYSYEIERVANAKVQRDGNYCRNIAKSTIRNKHIEHKYLLHSYNDICFENYHHKIFHIHGEARKPQSIILGHYYYGKLLSLYIDMLAKNENKQFEHQQAGEPPIVDSWLDTFIMGDVYVLGFGLDFSEMDIWWLLNRKKREKAQHGTIYFYEPAQGNEVKHSLLDTYDAKPLSLGFNTKPSSFENFYKYAIEDIRNRVILAKKKK